MNRRSSRSTPRAVAALLLGVTAALPVAAQLPPTGVRTPGDASAGAAQRSAPSLSSVRRMSLSSLGHEAEGATDAAVLSGDGQLVAFSSVAANLSSAGDPVGLRDVFVRDPATGQTSLVSHALGSVLPGNGASGASLDISEDGRYVAFDSWASDLVAGDLGGQLDVFVHDRLLDVTERVSVASSGAAANGPSTGASLSSDGRFVAFSSWADNLVAGDVNAVEDVFLHDRETGVTLRVSEQPDGIGGIAGSHSPAISADGRFVAFSTRATNLVPDELSYYHYIFVHDTWTDETWHASKNDNGEFSHGDCDTRPSISDDGRFVAFASWAYNLDLSVPDLNGVHDIFVHDRQTETTQRVSLNALGVEGDAGSILPSLSADGLRVAFTSGATNLVPGDRNGSPDVFVHDLLSGETICVSRDPAGQFADGSSSAPRLASDGGALVFLSTASDLVPLDANAAQDAFRGELP